MLVRTVATRSYPARPPSSTVLCRSSRALTNLDSFPKSWNGGTNGTDAYTSECSMLRKPPEVSPKASDSPVTMMMMTAMIFATGPSTDCRIWFSGCSQGMFEPAAQAGALARQG